MAVEKIRKTKNFMWTVIEVSVDKKTNKHWITPIEGVYGIKPENTTGTVRELFEQDLVNDSDRFLLAIREARPDFYEFEMITVATSLKEFIQFEYALADFVVNSGITKPTVLTIR